MSDKVDIPQEEFNPEAVVAKAIGAFGNLQRRPEPPKRTMIQQYEDWQKRLEDQLEGVKKVVSFLKEHPEVNELNALLEDVDRRGRQR